jgi:VanZ family protein
MDDRTQAGVMASEAHSAIQPIWPAPSVRWSVWLTFAVAWTGALLRPYPQVVMEHRELSLHFFLFGKTVHVSAYAVFAILSAWLFIPRRYRWLLLAFLSLHAIGTEMAQHFSPTRTPSPYDVGLDHLGILLGTALSWKWWRQPDSGRLVSE